MSKAKITKGIVRGIQTKKFEQVTISSQWEEEIEWKTPEEKEKEEKRVTQNLMKDFKETFNEAMKVIEVEGRCLGTVSVKKNDTDEPKEGSVLKKKDNDGEDEFDFWSH